MYKAGILFLSFPKAKKSEQTTTRDLEYIRIIFWYHCCMHTLQQLFVCLVFNTCTHTHIYLKIRYHMYASSEYLAHQKNLKFVIRFYSTQYDGPNIISLSPQHSTHSVTLLTCSLSFQQYNLPLLHTSKGWIWHFSPPPPATLLRNVMRGKIPKLHGKSFSRINWSDLLLRIRH